MARLCGHQGKGLWHAFADTKGLPLGSDIHLSVSGSQNRDREGGGGRGGGRERDIERGNAAKEGAQRRRRREVAMKATAWLAAYPWSKTATWKRKQEDDEPCPSSFN